MANVLRRTKIVSTLGPATDKEGVLEKIIEAGVNTVRMNFSHGSAGPAHRHHRPQRLRQNHPIYAALRLTHTYVWRNLSFR